MAFAVGGYDARFGFSYAQWFVYFAPSSIHFRSSPTSVSVNRGPVGGIGRDAWVTRARTLDFAAFPGTIAPVFVAPSNVSNRSPACRPASSGPWHATHFFPSKGRISR